MNPFTKPTRGSSESARRKCLQYWGIKTGMGLRMFCKGKGCKIMIDPVRDRWEADHTIPIAENGADECPNIKPLCKFCHDHKTNKEDKPRIAKGKRIRDRHYGVKRSTGFGKREGWKYDWKARRYIRIEEVE